MEGGLVCWHCGRPFAVPASRCPWCGQTIMVICAHCKQYTDVRGTVCEHCGAPLEPDRPESLRIGVGLDDRTAQLIADRRRARLVASGVVAQHLSEFFYADAQRRTVLVDLFGLPLDSRREAAGLLFAAIAYLVREGYCALQPAGDGESLLWAEVRPWDGQTLSLEGALARQAGLGQTLGQSLRQAIAEEAGIPPEQERPADRRRRPAAAPLPRPVAEGVVETARRTVLPEYPDKEACREVYQLLVQFVHRDPALARRVAGEILENLTWFQT
ncbi:MAG: double zinc ribbon domain-containing protein [Anaerolineae bacterium]